MPVLCNIMALTETDVDNSEGIQNSDSNSNEINDHITEDESSEELFISSVEIIVPKVAVPEKIILCIDISLDINNTGYAMKNLTEPSLSQTFVLKEALKLFLVNKISLHKSTQYALVVLKCDSVKWISDFTNDPQEIVSQMNDLEYTNIADVPSYDLTQVFQKIHQNITLPEEDCPIIMPPSEVYRAMIIYNSSKCIPKVDVNDHSFKSLITSPYFVLDILYLHEKESSDNNCQNIFNNLAGMCKNTSYILEVSRSVTKVFNNFAKLLAHPFQRVHLRELR